MKVILEEYFLYFSMLFEAMKKWVAESTRLLKVSDQVDYDLAAYAKEWKALLEKFPSPEQVSRSRGEYFFIFLI